MIDKEKIACDDKECEWNCDNQCCNESEYLACLLMKYYFNRGDDDVEQ